MTEPQIIYIYKSYTPSAKNAIYKHRSTHKEEFNKYMREWAKQKKEKDTEAYRLKKNEYQRTYYNKKKLLKLQQDQATTQEQEQN